MSIKFQASLRPLAMAFFVAVPQLSEIFQFLIHNTSRDFKAILGESFQFLKMKTKLHPKAMNAIRLKVSSE
jgi:hypothetical protein